MEFLNLFEVIWVPGYRLQKHIFNFYQLSVKNLNLFLRSQLGNGTFT